MSFYTYREGAERAQGAYGPVDQDTALFCPWQQRLDPTPEQELRAGWYHGPHLSNRNAQMVMRSLGYDTDDSYSLDPRDLQGRLLLASAVGGATADDGQPDMCSRGAGGATLIDCGLPAGYFQRIYGQLLPVCEQALAWDAPVLVG